MTSPNELSLVQFINWTVRDGVKLPISPKTRDVCDAHDASQWLSYADAHSKGPVAFVLTDNDPYFFIDLDKCRDDAGNWTYESQIIASSFIQRGAFAEVSQSGHGMHIMGRMSQMGVAVLRNKWDGWKEFYFTKRFIALGSYWQGSMDVDCTDLVFQTVPQRSPDEIELTGERDPDWSGPDDDEELIARMISSTGGLNSMFGGKAHVRELWIADRLERFFPIPEPRQDGLNYDASSADAALMAHLAFWTGRDIPRMDRLFKRSALMREKYEKRADYRKRTINGACRGCKKVYQGRGVVADASGGTNGDLINQNTTDDYPETIDLTRINQYFSGCVYVEDRHQILVPDGKLLKPEQFRVRYGGHLFIMSPYESRPSKDAFEAFTQNKAIKFPRVRTTCFRPDIEPYAIINTEEGLAINVFDLPEIQTTNENVDLFLEFIGKLLPDFRDQQILLSWMAFVVQHRGKKALWAIVLQGTQGNGKSFIRRALQYAVGESLTHCPNSEDMGEKYNAYIENTLLVAVEEVHMEGRRSMMDRLKPLITEDRVEIRAMAQDKRMASNLTNWLFMTNHKDAVIKTRSDRRYAVFYTAQQDELDLVRDGMAGEYFPKLWSWGKEGGFAAIAGYLNSYVGPPEFDPARGAHRAPITSSTEAAIGESMGSMEREILEAIETETVGFKNGWVSAERARQVLAAVGMKATNRAISSCLQNIGYEKIGRSPALPEEGYKQVSLYRLKGRFAHVGEYPSSQGYAR